MHTDTPLQKVRCRLYMPQVKPNAESADGSYSVYRVEGEHRLGFAYEYEVCFVSGEPFEVESLVDTDVRLLLEEEKEPYDKREIYGKVYLCKEQSVVSDKYLYSLRVVHPLYYLGLNRRYEIYQDKSAYDIIKSILSRYKALLNISFESNIPPHTFIKREYTTQYGQSDLEFIQMLCEQEGVTLYVKESLLPYSVRLLHINESYEKLKKELRCSFNLSKHFAATYAQEDYYDFRSPSLEYLNSDGRKVPFQTLEDNRYTSQLRHDMKVMRHRDRLEAPRVDDLKGHVRRSIRKEYSGAEKIEGHSKELNTVSGYGGELFDYKRAKKIEGIFTKVKIRSLFPNALNEHVQQIEGIKEYLYESTFEATPVKTPYIPPYDIKKPIIASSVTAIVSKGSKDTESTPNTIDVDSFGRIRVIFHFDPNYPTSCYIRFANFFTGDGWGSQFIPRVNTEVIVNFLNGDPDRPIAIGSLYNGNNKIPYDLPANKTQSYIKTQSMPGDNSRYNLLLFEDKASEELVHIRAQKDYKLHALHNSYINIDNDQTEEVGNDESFVVGNDRSKSIGHDESIDIGNDRSKRVGNDETIYVGNDQNITIGNDQNTHIQKSKALRVDKDYLAYVGNHRVEETYANYTLKVGGHNEVTVNGRVDLKAGESVKSVTKVHTLSGSDKVVIKGNGGTIILDGSGITLKGNVTVKGNVAISTGGGGGTEDISLQANSGDLICIPCLLS